MLRSVFFRADESQVDSHGVAQDCAVFAAKRLQTVEMTVKSESLARARETVHCQALSRARFSAMIRLLRQQTDS
jgi:hypothetical protein